MLFEVIVGIIGVEIIYGCYMGNFCVFDVLMMFMFDYLDMLNCDSC